MNRTLIIDTLSKVGETVTLKGWIATKRDHGKLTFIDLRDRSGKIQLVGYQKMSELGTEDAIEITGTVKSRSEKSINLDLETGKVEIESEMRRTQA